MLVTCIHVNIKVSIQTLHFLFKLIIFLVSECVFFLQILEATCIHYVASQSLVFSQIKKSEIITCGVLTGRYNFYIVDEH